MLERFDQHLGVHAGRYIRISIGPGLCRRQGGELDNHQATGEAGISRVVAVYRRMRAGQYQAAFGLQLFQALDVGRAYGQAFLQGVGDVGGNDGVEHVSPRFSAW